MKRPFIVFVCAVFLVSGCAHKPPIPDDSKREPVNKTMSVPKR